MFLVVVSLFDQPDVQRQGSSNDDFSGRNGHGPSKAYNDRSGYNGGKWYNEKRANNRRNDDLRSKGDFNYREQSSGRNAGNSGNAKVSHQGFFPVDLADVSLLRIIELIYLCVSIICSSASNGIL